MHRPRCGYQREATPAALKNSRAGHNQRLLSAISVIVCHSLEPKLGPPTADQHPFPLLSRSRLEAAVRTAGTVLFSIAGPLG